MPTKPFKTQVQQVPNPMEAIKEVGSGLGDSFKKDVAQGITSDFFGQLLNFSLDGAITGTEKSADKPKKAGKSGEIFSASGKKPEHKKPAKAEARSEAAMNYFAEIGRSSERANKSEIREMDKNVQEIMNELRRLIDSSKALRMDFAALAVDQKPTNIGKYHLNFFEWMLLVVRDARRKVENSGAWLNTVKGKNGKANWNKMTDKGTNTSVTLSNERQVATSVG